MWQDSETNSDYIDFEYLADLIDSIIKNDNLLPASIGVFGNWGSGKSSIMRLSEQKLSQEKDILTISFNSWLFEGYEDAKKSLINIIIDTFEEKNKDTLKYEINEIRKKISFLDISKIVFKNIPNIITSVVKPGVSFLSWLDIAKSISNDIKELNNDDEFTYGKKIRNDIVKFRENFNRLIEKSDFSRIVVYIDELDRCNTDTILETLEAMRLFLFCGKVAFVIGADERQISLAIKNKYSDIFFDENEIINIGKEYLEKIIQYPIRIPIMTIPETELYLTCLLLSDSLKENASDFNEIKMSFINDFRGNNSNFILGTNEKYNKYQEIINTCYNTSKLISSLLNVCLNGNPRQFKRFLNEFEMRKNIAKFKNVEIDNQILIKMMILQYVKPSIYDDFIKLIYEDKLKNNLDFYKNKSEKTKKKWGDDQWLSNWINQEPDIINIDLNRYVSLSRSNKVYNFASLSNHLSVNSQNILKAYSANSKIKIRQSKLLIDEIDVMEGNTLIKIFFEKMSKSNNNDMIKVFIAGIVDIGIIKEECAYEALSQLEKIDNKNIDASIVYRVKDFSKSSNVEEKYKALKDLWIRNNSKLKKFFD